MKHWLLITIAALALCCGGTSENANNARQTNVPSARESNANPVLPTDLNPQQANVPARPPETSANRLDRKKLEVPSSDTPPPMQFQPAGEDSEFAATMNAAGAIYEVRIFKSHPKLARVEAVWTSPKERELKITMRDGQVREVKTNRIQNLKQATTRQLVEIAGS